MKRLRAIVTALWIFVMVIAPVTWFGAGFQYVQKDEVVAFVEPTGYGSWIHAESDDSGWYWSPLFLMERWTTQLPFVIPSFRDWLRMAEAWDKEVDYYAEYFNYHAPQADWSLRSRTLDILPYLAAKDIYLVDVHLPAEIEFEKYDPRERYRLAGYYMPDEDRVAMNEEYLWGKAWDDKPYLSTLVHELIHSTGHFNESHTEFLTYVVLARMAQDGDMEAAWSLAISMRGDALGMAYVMSRWDFTVPVSDPWAAMNIAHGLHAREKPYTGWVLQDYENSPQPWFKVTYRINQWLRQQRHATWQVELRDTVQRLLTPAEQFRRATTIKAWAEDPAAHQAAFIQYVMAPQFMRLATTGDTAILEVPEEVLCSFMGCFLLTRPQEVDIHYLKMRTERIYPAEASRYSEANLIRPERGGVVEYSPSGMIYSLGISDMGATAVLLYALSLFYGSWRGLRWGTRRLFKWRLWQLTHRPMVALRAEVAFLRGERE